MANKLNTKAVVLTVGTMFGLLHLIGVIGIFLGLLNYWSWAHFVNIDFTVATFDFAKLVVGTVTAFLIGSIVGWLFTLIYNKLS